MCEGTFGGQCSRYTCIKPATDNDNVDEGTQVVSLLILLNHATLP